jgi:uncharacterized protein
MAVTVRQLGLGDEGRLAGFLEGRADSSMFLRANLDRSGLVDTGLPYAGTWVAALAGDRIEAVVALFWSGFLALQAPDHLGPILEHLTGLGVRPVRGLLGPLAQTDAALRLLGLVGAPARKASREDLFALTLDRLVVPARLASGHVRRRSRP